MIWSLAILPALAGLAIWRFGGSDRTRLGVLGAGVVGLTALLALFAGGTSGRFAWAPELPLTAALPPEAQAVAVTVAIIALAVLIFAAAHEAEAGLPRLVGLLLVFTGGMQLVVIASDLVTLLVGWEIVGACSWALIGHRWDQNRPGRSANYAFVMTRAGDLGLFVALFATYAATGGTGYADLARLDPLSLNIVAAGILVAAASKAGQVPFAPWLYRAMDGPTSVSAHLHSATMVAAGVYLLARLQPDLAGAAGFSWAALTIGLTTAVFGGVAALRQMHAKKVLAGSTSAQMGLMIAAVGAGFPGIAIFHLVAHAATKAALFFSAGIAHGAAHGFDLREMRLGRALPHVAGLTALAALSLAAVPPVAASWSKEEIVKALEHAGPLVGAIGVVAGGLSAAYAARYLWMAFGPGPAHAHRPARGETAALGLLGFAIILLSTLWLPAVHDPLARAFGTDLPDGSFVFILASLASVVFGLLAGVRLARHPGADVASEWFGLPALIDAAIVRPFHALSAHAARIDDLWLDFIPRGAVRLAHIASGNASDADRRGLPGLIPDGAAILTRLSGAWADLTDGRGVPALIPGGAARVTGMAGADLRRAQTGLSHHYYVLLASGVAFSILFLILGG